MKKRSRSSNKKAIVASADVFEHAFLVFCTFDVQRFVRVRAWNITKNRWKIRSVDQQWYLITARLVEFFFLRITWRVWFFNFSIISLKDSNGENQKKRATNTAPFLLFYVSICRRIRKIIVLSLLSRLLEILQLFLRQFNFPTIPHQTLTDNNERFVLNCLIRSLKWKKKYWCTYAN